MHPTHNRSASRLLVWSASLLAVVVATVALLTGGLHGLAYLGVYVLATVPGWPLGMALFGRRHAAGWVAGALLGYVLTALAIWAAIAARRPTPVVFVGVWAAVCAVTWLWAAWRRGRPPLVPLPPWRRRDTIALVLTLLIGPLLAAAPFRHVGATDDQGVRQYRAYFTADLLWHEALTAELAKFEMPPRNPYLAAEPVSYYWTYFLLPAATGDSTFASSLDPLETRLLVNALGTGLVFLAAVFVAAWSVAPRAGAVAAAVVLATVGASAEGFYAIWQLSRDGVPLSGVRGLNIDAITAWWFPGISVDGLPRALWYTPQHSMALALGVMALVVAGAAGLRARPAASAGASACLGAAFVCSPFTGGAFTLIYALTMLAEAARLGRASLVPLLRQAAAAAPFLAAFSWALANNMLGEANGQVQIAWPHLTVHTGLVVPALALGPLLLPVIGGIALTLRRRAPAAARPVLVGLAAGVWLIFFVVLTPEPIWIGWRAGQVLLVLMPAMAAILFATLWDRKTWRVAGASLAAVLLVVGLPTTIIDTYNTQDIGNHDIGPGFRWTVTVSPDEQAALMWIRRYTPADAVVQMAPSPRGRETWTQVPSLGRRRMAAGLPISLLRVRPYEAESARAERIFELTDADAAWQVARAMGVRYVYVDRVERTTYSRAAIEKFFLTPERFRLMFQRGDAAVIEVRAPDTAGRAPLAPTDSRRD